MLTKRLNRLVAALPRCDTLADVGCDHGYIGVEALERNLAQHVIFVDISAASLNKARNNCPDELKDRAQFLCQDGLNSVKCDCAIIAGMGGMEIISVLQQAVTLPQTLVLQPMRNQQDVRKWLSRNYNIVTDEMFFDGKYYDLIVARKCDGGCALTEKQIVFGKNTEHPTPDFWNYLRKLQQEYQHILQQCNDTEVKKKYDFLCSVIAEIKEEQQ